MQTVKIKEQEYFFEFQEDKRGYSIALTETGDSKEKSGFESEYPQTMDFVELEVLTTQKKEKRKNKELWKACKKLIANVENYNDFDADIMTIKSLLR